ncbi:MAG: hypothetical protein IKQ44_08105 [Lachnospiraceae bacterium]|nr:hypothetical protein [Lachnospiraceae bacterium]
MIIFAYNSYSDYSKCQNPTACIDPIKASDAHKSRVYFCTDCGCKMHTRTEANGASYFVCYEGERHTGAVCSQLAKNSNRTIIDTDIANFDIDKFFEKIMKERIEAYPKLPGGIEGPESAGDDPDPDEYNNGGGNIDTNDSMQESDFPNEVFPVYPDGDESEIKVKCPAELKDIIDILEFDRRSPDYIINKAKNIKVMDLLFTYRYTELFNNPDILSNNTRVLGLKPITPLGKNSILAEMYNTKVNGRLRFIIHFNDQKQYNKISSCIFPKNEKTSKETLNYESRYISIFILACWQRSSDYTDTNGNTHIEFTGEIVNKNQIHLPKKYLIKKKS